MRLSLIIRNCVNLIQYGANAPLVWERIYVSLAEVTTVILPSDMFHRNETAKVMGGGWDCSVRPLSQHPEYQEICAYFVEGEGQKIKRPETSRWYDHIALYEHLKAGGEFKTRQQLGQAKSQKERGGVYIHIGRNGNPIFGGNAGNHRLAIALLLNLKCIPALLGVVHLDAVKSGSWKRMLKPPVTV